MYGKRPSFRMTRHASRGGKAQEERQSRPKTAAEARESLFMIGKVGLRVTFQCRHLPRAPVPPIMLERPFVLQEISRTRRTFFLAHSAPTTLSRKTRSKLPVRFLEIRGCKSLYAADPQHADGEGETPPKIARGTEHGKRNANDRHAHFAFGFTVRIPAPTCVCAAPVGVASRFNCAATFFALTPHARYAAAAPETRPVD